ncbi:MAG: NAD(P)-dependent alcohol dehydrogenase [Myxococcota bacterium]
MKGLVLREGQLTMAKDLVPRPPDEGEVEVRVVSASVNPTDIELAAGVYDDMLARAGMLDRTRTGLEFSGVVTTPGKRFQPGDEVFGYVDLLEGAKSHQERIAIGEALIARKPAAWSFAEAAAVPLGAQTSLVALRDVANAQAGERILINGAAGGLGVYAVQLAARVFRLHVTAVAGPGQGAFLKGLGADEVLDYTAERPLANGERYDIIFDLTTRWQFDEVEASLTPTGRFMPSEPLKAGVDFSEGARSGARSVNLWVGQGDGDVLAEVAALVANGTLQVFVDSVYPFEAHQEAFARLKQPSKRGRVVMTLEDAGRP